MIGRILSLVVALSALALPASAAAPAGMVRIQGGWFRPADMPVGTRIRVAPFVIDSVPVARAGFAVTGVTWYSASAYCKARGARLPTTNEWEYLAQANEKLRNASTLADFRQHTLELALARRSGPFAVGSGLRNIWGVRDIHGGIREWTLDFAPHMRHTATCAGGTVENGDAGDYAAFMRYSYRTRLTAGVTSPQLGFRCAASL
jgi:formylglycine-generating enzyme required for sulfatase activity